MSSDVFDQMASQKNQNKFSNLIPDKENSMPSIVEIDDSDPFESRSKVVEENKYFPGGRGSIWEKFGKSLSMQPNAKEFTEATNVGMKSSLSNATLSQSQKISGLKISEEEKEKYPELINISGMAGDIAPIGVFGKLASWGGKATKAGAAGRIAIHGGAGGAYSATKQLSEKGEIDPVEVVKEAGLWSLFGVGGELLARSPKVKQFSEYLSKEFGPKGKFSGKGPPGEPPGSAGPDYSDLPPSEFEYFDKEIFPEMEKIFSEELEQATNVRRQQLDQSYTQELANTRAKHLNEVEAQQAEQVLKSQYESDLANIEKENQQLIQEFERQKQVVAKTQQNEQAVQSALSQNMGEGSSLQGRVTRGESDLSVRPLENIYPSPIATESMNDISPTVFRSRRVGGQALSDVVQAHSQIEYRFVNRAYDNARNANQGIEAIQPELAANLQRSIAEIDAIPQPSPPKIQLRNSNQRLLESIVQMDENGTIIGYTPISNHILLEQAKDLRFFMDYEFANANPKGIFSPTLSHIDEAAEFAAIAAGNREAYQLNREARDMYRNWSQRYNNDVVNKFRSREKLNFQKNFDSVLNVDEYMQLARATEISPTGNLITNQLKRSMVQKHLGGFFERPFTKGSTQQFNTALEEIRPALSDSEFTSLRNAYLEGRRGSVRGKKLLPPKNPAKPVLKPKPIEPKVRELKDVTLPKRKFIESDIPKGKQELFAQPSEAMKSASKMLKMKPEDLMKMAEKPSGMRELKQNLKGSQKGDILFDNIGRFKLRNIRYGNSVKPITDSKKIFNNLSNSKNFDMMVEVLGKEEAYAMLEASEKAANANEPWVLKTAEKYIKKYVIVKGLLKLGLL